MRILRSLENAISRGLLSNIRVYLFLVIQAGNLLSLTQQELGTQYHFEVHINHQVWEGSNMVKAAIFWYLISSLPDSLYSCAECGLFRNKGIGDSLFSVVSCVVPNIFRSPWLYYSVLYDTNARWLIYNLPLIWAVLLVSHHYTWNSAGIGIALGSLLFSILYGSRGYLELMNNSQEKDNYWIHMLYSLATRVSSKMERGSQ